MLAKLSLIILFMIGQNFLDLSAASKGFTEADKRMSILGSSQAIEPIEVNQINADSGMPLKIGAKEVPENKKSKTALKIGCGIVVSAALLCSFGYACLCERNAGSGDAYKGTSPNANVPCSEIVGQLVTLRQIKEIYQNDYITMFDPKFADIDSYGQSAGAAWGNSLYLGQNGEISYCIFSNKDGKLIGGIRIKKNGAFGNLANWINPKYFGTGCAREALGFAIQRYFEINKNITHVTAHVSPRNIRSLSSLEKFGFRLFEDDSLKMNDDITLEFTRPQ